MTLQQLQYLVSLKRTLNFRKTARECSVAQSSVSILLKSLETELGVQLFERKTRSVKITPIGEEVAHLAEDIFSLTNQIRECALIDTAKSLEINVFVETSFSYVITDLKLLSHQDIKVNTTFVDNINTTLLTSHLDFIICEDNGTKLPDGFSKRTLFTESVHINRTDNDNGTQKRKRNCIVITKDKPESSVIAAKIAQLFN